MMAAVLAFCRKVIEKFINIGSNESSPENRNQDRRSKENMFAKFLSPFESYIVSIQSLLIWERPYISAIALLIVNIAYWVIVTCSRRLYSFVAVVSLIVFIYRAWVYQIWPEIRVAPPEGTDTEGWTPVHPQVFSVPELSQHLNDCWLAMCRWWEAAFEVRKTQPGLFCAVSCGTFTLLALAGRLVPGVVLVYFIVMLMSFGPGLILYVVPNTWWQKSEDVTSGGSQDGSVDRDSELDEFLPDGSRDVDLTISEHHHSTESLDSNNMIARDLGIENMVLEATEHEESLSQGLGSFPNLEEEGSDDDELVDIPALLVAAALSSAAAAASATTTGGTGAQSSGNGNGIHFVASHFKDASSDSETEEAFIEGLSFSRASVAAESMLLESSVSRPLAISTQRPLTGSPSSVVPPSSPSSSSLSAKISQGGGTLPLTSSSGTGNPVTTTPKSKLKKTGRSPSAELDISEYELVSESELSS